MIRYRFRHCVLIIFKRLPNFRKGILTVKLAKNKTKKPALSFMLVSWLYVIYNFISYNLGSEESDSGYFSFPEYLMGTTNVSIAKLLLNLHSG